MSEMRVGAVASEYSSNAKISGLTNWAMKVGNPNHITTAGNPNHITTAENTNHVTTVSQDSDALVKEVAPILEKYSK